MRTEASCWLPRPHTELLPCLYCRDWSYTDMPSREVQDATLTAIFSFGAPMSGRNLVEHQRRLSAMFPRWTVFVGMASQRRVMEADNSHVITWSDALLTREDFWVPSLDTAYYYAAVTTTDWDHYNRHELLQTVDRNLIISRTRVAFKAREETLRADLRLSYVASVSQRIQEDAGVLRSYFGQAACGLVLSDIDGGARMVSEFQLCGLPVVATRAGVYALGFCDLEFVRIAAETHESVASAVREFELSRPDPYAVRWIYLSNMQAGRREAESILGPVAWDRVPVRLSDSNPASWSLP
jgi:hypothetical protein